MFSFVRRRFSFTNVVMTIVLVFTMTGGALAASRYLITSTKQISPNVLRELKAAKEVAGGAIGQPGPAGKEGPTGREGPTGKEGPTGREGPAGKEGPQGKEGRSGPVPPSGTLEADETETGAWEISTGAEENPVAAISFAIPLPAALGESHVHYVEKGGTGPTCPGTAEEPMAEPGNLCVYQVFTENIMLEGGLAKGALIANPGEAPLSGTPGAAPSGALVRLKAETGAKSVYAYGTWAVTEG